MTTIEMKDCGILDKLWDDIEAYSDAHCSGDSINIYAVAMIIGKYRALNGECMLCKCKESRTVKVVEHKKDINNRCERGCPYWEARVEEICNYDGDGCGWY